LVKPQSAVALPTIGRFKSWHRGSKVAAEGLRGSGAVATLGFTPFGPNLEQASDFDGELRPKVAPFTKESTDRAGKVFERSNRTSPIRALWVT